jgi:hypothetical protein
MIRKELKNIRKDLGAPPFLPSFYFSAYIFFVFDLCLVHVSLDCPFGSSHDQNKLYAQFYMCRFD